MKRLLVILALVLFVAASADAATIYYQHTGTGLTNSFSATYASGSTTRTYGYFAGQLMVTGVPGTSGELAVYCLDFMDYLYSPQTMEVRNLSDFPTLPGDAPPQALPGTGTTVAYLLNTYGFGSLSNVQAAALQLAIWEVVLDTNHSLTGGLFTAAGTNVYGTQAVTLANQYLQDVGTSTNGVWLDVIDTTSRGGQDFAFAVPEPGSMLLLGVGLFGLAWAARRRSHGA